MTCILSGFDKKGLRKLGIFESHFLNLVKKIALLYRYPDSLNPFF